MNIALLIRVKLIAAPRAIFLILSLFFCLSAPAEGPFLSQELHTRTLAFDTWTGGYVKGTYNGFFGTVRFEACYIHGDPGCQLIVPEIPFAKFGSSESDLLNELRALRNKLARDANNNVWRFVVGGADRNADVIALDMMIADLQDVGLQHWVFLTEENLRSLGPEFSGPEVMEKFIAILKKNFAQYQDPQ
jgi:hypothetical protein